VSSTAKRRLVLALKILVTALLCGLIVWKGDWHEVGRVLRTASPWLVFTAFVCMLLNVPLSALKWKILLEIHGESFKLGRLTIYYFIAVFFNNFLPSIIGGDSYRIYKTATASRSKTAAILAIFSERLTGIVALVLLGFIASWVIFSSTQSDAPDVGRLIPVFGTMIAVTIIAILLLIPIRYRLKKSERLPGKIRILLNRLGDYRRHPKKTMQIVLLSFLFHAFTFLWVLILIRALGTTLNYFHVAIAVSVSSLVAMIPISINGIGLWDGSFIYVAGKLGLDYNHALMVMIMQRFMLILLSMVGGFFYLQQRQPQEIERLRQPHEPIRNEEPV
jgi:uncharacterized protein (TIRG00374 family)